MGVAGRGEVRSVGLAAVREPGVPRDRGQPRTRAADIARIAPPPAGGASSVHIARVRFEGNWNPEPGAWDALDLAVGNAMRIEISSVPLAQLDASATPLAHLAGAGPIKWTDADVEGLRRFVDAGGTLFVESVGGRAEFSRAALTLLRQAFPTERARGISLGDPLITGEGIGGYDVSKVRMRDYSVRVVGPIQTPNLLALSRDGKPAVIITSDDLSSGMLGHRAWGVIGYRADSARMLAFNIARYAASRSR